MKKRCGGGGSFGAGQTTNEAVDKAAVMAEIKENLPMDMTVNHVYGLSQSVTNLPQRESHDTFGELYKPKSHVSVYEDVS